MRTPDRGLSSPCFLSGRNEKHGDTCHRILCSAHHWACAHRVCGRNRPYLSMHIMASVTSCCLGDTRSVQFFSSSGVVTTDTPKSVAICIARLSSVAKTKPRTAAIAKHAASQSSIIAASRTNWLSSTSPVSSVKRRTPLSIRGWRSTFMETRWFGLSSLCCLMYKHSPTTGSGTMACSIEAATIAGRRCDAYRLIKQHVSRTTTVMGLSTRLRHWTEAIFEREGEIPPRFHHP